MKTKSLFCLTVLVLIFLQTFSQEKTQQPDLLIKSTHDELYPIHYQSKDYDSLVEANYYHMGYGEMHMWRKNKQAEVSAIFRQSISPKYYEQLNKKMWIIHMKVTSYGQVASISIYFKEDLLIDINELSKLAEDLKKNVTYELTFSKKVTDFFYVPICFVAPKL